ncbi:MAG: carboxy terminal-processing peptidase [Puniceicoccales bacterium]|jgi:carboxyl-terminal processing protease|nr:carboxy terminal-processing peptidase [Puniceicoccales bacterium]
MVSIWRNFLLWSIFCIFSPRVCIGESASESRISIPNKPESYREKREKTSAEITFEEPVFTPLEQTSAMRLETICMMKCLEDIHYARKKLKNLDAKKIIEEYVEHIDIYKMLFLQKEIDDFGKHLSPSLGAFLNGGSLTPGFSIYDCYRQKNRDCVLWVLQRIDQDEFELFSDVSFIVDREKEKFLQTKEELKKLWEVRLNFEMVTEIILQESWERKQEQAIIDDSRKNRERYLGSFLSGTVKRDNLPKVVKPDDMPKQKKSKMGRREVVFGIANILKTNRSVCEPLYIWSNVYRLHLDGGNVKLPLTLPEKIELAKKNIKQRYKSLLRNISQLEPWVVQEQFINSVSRTYDPHTVFMSHESMEDLRMALHHSFVGIGAYLSDDNGSCIISELVPGGPAARSGDIQVGDRIIAVAQDNEDSVDVSGMLLNKISKLLRGKKNTKVSVTIRPAGDVSEQKMVTLVRDEIELTESRASSKFFSIEENNRERKIGVLTLPSFYGDNEKDIGTSNSATDIIALIQKLKAKNIDGLILDLRDNNGGILEQSVLVAGLFIDGPTVQVRGQCGNIDRFNTKSSQIFWDGPLIVLISRMTASAAEILVGALKDHNRAVIVGDKSTHGKGTVQVLLPMEQLFSKFKYKENLGASKVTIQKWYRPSGISTQIKGVEADIVFPSFDEFLPIGESDLPHAIEWDTIDPVKFSIQDKIRASQIQELKHLSQQRQESLPEFQLLSERIERLKEAIATKSFSTNLAIRRAEKLKDERIQRNITAQSNALAKNNDPAVDVLLDVVEKRNAEKKMASGKIKEKSKPFDTHLKESLRIMIDLLNSYESIATNS